MARTDRKSKRKNRDRPDEPFEPVMVDVSGSTPQESTDTDTDTDTEEETDSPATDITTRDVSPEADADSEWRHRDWPASVGARGTGYQVIIKRSVLNTINRHGKTTSDVEVCGVMVGNVYRDNVGAYLYVDACVVGEKAGHSAAQVTFTAETWTHIQGVMETEHPDRRVVGWYHTHPGFGIFLSDMDLFIHGNFFNLPWQIAFVYDPISGEEGLFIWRDGKTERVHFAIEEDAEKEIVVIPVSPEVAAAALADFSVRVQKMEQRQKTVWVILALLAMVAVAWPFVLYTIMAEKPRRDVAPATHEQDSTPPRQTQAAPKEETAPALATEPAPVVAPHTEIPLKVVPTTVAAPTLPAKVDKSENKSEPSLIRPTRPSTNGARVLESPRE